MKTELNRLLVALRASHALSDTEFEAVQESLSDCEEDTAVGRLLQDLVQAQKITSYQAKRLAGGQPLLLGEYLIQELLGEGGMGKVFKATHLRLGRPAALKVIHDKYLQSDPQSAARFLREGRAIARLKHPNIVTAYDASVQDGMHFLVMEYIEGVTLGQLVAVGGPLSISESMNFLTQAAEALECAHRHGVVHRDIKPTNLMVERSTHKIKVLDLGVAQLAADKRDGACAEELTVPGEIMGTFDYMAPEQANDAKLVDHRADIYSLGCTLYLMITGKKIYEHATTRFEKARAHREEPIPGLAKYRPDVPTAVAELYEQMVKKDPDQRLQSMAEIINQSRQIGDTLFRDGAPTATMKPSPGTVATVPHEADAAISVPVAKPGGVAKPNSKRRRGTFAAAAALVALLAIAAILWPILFPPRVPVPPPPPPVDPVAVRLALLEFLAAKRQAVVGEGAAVAQILVIRDDQPPQVANINGDFAKDDLGDIATIKQVEVVSLDLGDTQIVDTDLKRLADVAELEQLSLHRCELLTDEAFRPLQELENLRSIDLRCTRLSGQGLRLLPDAPFEEIKVDGFHRKLTGQDLVDVAGRFEARLERLSVQGVSLDASQRETLQKVLEEVKAEPPRPELLQ